MSRRLRIAFDMDEVLADTLTAQLAWFRERYGYELSKESLAGRHLEEAVEAAHRDEHERHLGEGGFFDDLPVMPGSQHAVEAILRHHDVYVASAATEYPRSCAVKFAWLRRHFPMVPPDRIIFCGDKGVLAMDVLVDDHCRHFRHFVGQGVLFSAPHNLRLTDWPRLRDWDHALTALASPAPLLGRDFDGPRRIHQRDFAEPRV